MAHPNFYRNKGENTVERYLTYSSPIVYIANQFFFWFYFTIKKTTGLFIVSSEYLVLEEGSCDTINDKAEQILNTYGDSILRFSYSYLHNMSDAEDILQDTLIQFLKVAPTFKSEQHKKAWLLPSVSLSYISI